MKNSALVVLLVVLSRLNTCVQMIPARVSHVNFLLSTSTGLCYGTNK